MFSNWSVYLQAISKSLLPWNKSPGVIFSLCILHSVPFIGSLYMEVRESVWNGTHNSGTCIAWSANQITCFGFSTGESENPTPNKFEYTPQFELSTLHANAFHKGTCHLCRPYVDTSILYTLDIMLLLQNLENAHETSSGPQSYAWKEIKESRFHIRFHKNNEILHEVQLFNQNIHSFIQLTSENVVHL